MTTATKFSRQNDANSRVSTTWYRENLVLVVVLVVGAPNYRMFPNASLVSKMVFVFVFLKGNICSFEQLLLCRKVVKCPWCLTLTLLPTEAF